MTNMMMTNMAMTHYLNYLFPGFAVIIISCSPKSNNTKIKTDKPNILILYVDELGYDDNAEEMLGDHKPWGQYRGGKHSAYAAGTRGPNIAYWPSEIETGESNALINRIDFNSSIASIVGHELSDKEVPDSYNMLPELLKKINEG